eukprot:snap_masked-scaffold_1-processed-gene-32.13-mRNA-1 protein AED:0.12 eAED:1.00 QI:0/-1/0/1/-1/1/1/0/305
MGDFNYGDSTREVTEQDLREISKNNNVDVPVWTGQVDGSSFNVRCGPNYKVNKTKQASLESFYTCVTVDVVKASSVSEKIEHVASKYPLPCVNYPTEILRELGLPKYIVINIQVPFKTAPMMYTPKNYYDQDTGFSIILIFLLNQEIVDLAVKGEISETNVKSYAQLKLLKRFNLEALNNSDIRRRFKGILVCDNWDEMMEILSVSGLNMMKKYNGKPLIINKMGEIYQDENKTEYLEMVVKISRAVLLARKALDSFRSKSPAAVLRMGFTIQGESDEELPENIFACASVSNIVIDEKHIPTIEI